MVMSEEKEKDIDLFDYYKEKESFFSEDDLFEDDSALLTSKEKDQINDCYKHACKEHEQSKFDTEKKLKELEVSEEDSNKIDWTQIFDESDLKNLRKEQLYDYTIDYGGKLQIREGLFPHQVKEAKFLKKLAKGLMLNTGHVGSGKSLYMTATNWKMREYYDMTSILDYRPRALFDELGTHNSVYIFCSVAFLVNQMDRMMSYSDAGHESSANENEWISNIGKIFLKNAVISKDEFQKDMPRTNAMKPIGKAIGDLFTIWRHLQICFIGNATKRNDINRKRCFPELTSEAETTWSEHRKDTGLVVITPRRFVSGKNVLEKVGKPIRIAINGRRPRPELQGHCWYELYNSWNCIGLTPSESLR